jgi:hypothetical protein
MNLPLLWVRLPFALSQLSGYIEESGCSLNSLHDDFRDRSARLTWSSEYFRAALRIFESTLVPMESHIIR